MDALPIELVSRIFLWECESLTDIALLRYRLTISAVCSSWRTTALSTQQLWSSINVHIKWDTVITNALALLATHLERAYSVPIDVTLTAYLLSDSTLRLARLWDAMSKHLHHCRTLRIVGNVSPGVFLPLRDPMNCLEYLEISIFAPVRPPAMFFFWGCVVLKLKYFVV